MSSTNKTTYYELPQFVDSDLFNPLVDDNDAYEKIDTALHNNAELGAGNASEIVGVKSRVTTAEGKIEALETQNGVEVLSTTAQTLSGAVNELDADVASLDGRVDTVEDDINNENTGLKVKVDSLGTRMTTAEGDIDALETQNGNSVLKTVAQTLSGAINENFDKIATYGTIYTPEMFGAVGDGVADDTTAVQSAINAGRCCVLNKTYKTTAPISISSDKFVVLNGTINYDGNDCAIALSSDPHIVGTGTVTSTGNAVISNKLLPLRFAVVEGLVLRCETADANIIHLESSSSDNSVSNNRFVRLRLTDDGSEESPVAESGIYLHSVEHGYLNENRFEQIHFTGSNFAIKMLIEADHNMNRNQFIQVTTESSAHALYAKGGFVNDASQFLMHNVFDFRTLEFGGREEIIQVDNFMRDCVFYGSFCPYNFKSLSEPVDDYISILTYHPSQIIGDVHYDNGECSNGNTKIMCYNGHIFFDFNIEFRSSIITGGDTGVVALTYSGLHGSTAGYKIYRFSSGATAITLDLNNHANIYFSAPKWLNITSDSGTDVTIVNGDTTLMAQTHLAKGYHELMFVPGVGIIVVNSVS